MPTAEKVWYWKNSIPVTLRNQMDVFQYWQNVLMMNTIVVNSCTIRRNNGNKDLCDLINAYDKAQEDGNGEKLLEDVRSF